MTATQEPVPAPAPPTGAPTPLRRTLSARQINMVAIGGIIGTGLFVGSGVLVAATGPAVLLAYLVMGAVVVIVMRMLGEMAVASPDSGSYAAYASREIGSWAGAMCTYTAIYGGIVVVALEATVVGSMLHAWFPAVSAAWWALLVALALAASNLLRVGLFAEVEFWLAVVKVVAIVAFIGLGLLGFLGVLPDVRSPGLSNWLPLAPHGWAAVAAACVTVMFGYVGAEQVVVLAAEARDPAAATRRAISSVVARILVFYIGSILVVVTFVPSASAALANGSYAAVLDRLGLSWLGTGMNVVILFSLLSLTNTTIYTTSRMLFAAAGRGELPRRFSAVAGNGVPRRAVLVVAVVALALVSINLLVPATEFLSLLMAFVGAGAVVTYSVIAITQLRFRRRLSTAEVQALSLRSCWHPWGGIVVLVVMAAVLLALASAPTMRLSVVLTLCLTAVGAGVGALVQRRRRA